MEDVQEPRAMPYREILEQVLALPAPQRFHLLQEVLGTFAPGELKQRRLTAEEAMTILPADTPVPNDEQVREIIEQALLERYGIADSL